MSGFGLGLLVRQGFLGAKAGHSDRAVRRVEESCFGFLKAKETALLKKQAKFKGEGKPTLSMRWFPLSLSPLPIYLPETLQFRAAPKNAVHFLYGAVLHRPGEHPWTPYAMLSLFDAGVLISEFSVSGIRGLWLTAFDWSGFLGAKAGFVGFGLGLLVSSGFFDAKAGFVEGCNLWNVLYNPEAYVW